MDINVMETWNDREVEVNGLDSQQRPISMYAASSTDRPAENGLSRSDGKFGQSAILSYKG